MQIEPQLVGAAASATFTARWPGRDASKKPLLLLGHMDVVTAKRKDVMDAVTKAVHARLPKLPIVPTLSPGATDSRDFRALGVPMYGVSGLFIRPADDFAHVLNERIPLDSIEPAAAF